MWNKTNKHLEFVIAFLRKEGEKRGTAKREEKPDYSAGTGAFQTISTYRG